MTLATLPLGLVLAGGRSRRFGVEKAMIEIDGAPILARVFEVLAAGCARVAVNAPPASGAAHWARAGNTPCLQDAPEDAAGPLAGVRAGLRWARDAGVDVLATAPCDTPRLPPDLVARLTVSLPPSAGAATARTVDGPQPLCAVWRVSALETIQAALSRGEHPPVRRVLEQLEAVSVAFDEAAAFTNLNTPQDLDALRG